MVARQFQNIPRLRIEGLLAAFPKLLGSAGLSFPFSFVSFSLSFDSLFLKNARQTPHLSGNRFSSIFVPTFGSILCCSGYKQVFQYFGRS